MIRDAAARCGEVDLVGVWTHEAMLAGEADVNHKESTCQVEFN